MIKVSIVEASLKGCLSLVSLLLKFGALTFVKAQMFFNENRDGGSDFLVKISLWVISRLHSEYFVPVLHRTRVALQTGSVCLLEG